MSGMRGATSSSAKRAPPTADVQRCSLWRRRSSSLRRARLKNWAYETASRGRLSSTEQGDPHCISDAGTAYWSRYALLYP
jgi:hypothetical protein